MEFGLLLMTLLCYQDKKSVESCCLCFSRLTDNLSKNPVSNNGSQFDVTDMQYIYTCSCVLCDVLNGYKLCYW